MDHLYETQSFPSVDATEETGRYGRLINHSLKKSNCATKVRKLAQSCGGMSSRLTV